MSQRVAKRIRVFFINCPTLATDAAGYLILAQNKVQRAIQFEVHHFWIFGGLSQGPLEGWLNKILESAEDKHPRFIRLASRNRTLRDLRAAPPFRKTLYAKHWYDDVKKAIEDYDRWFMASGYNKHDYQEAPAIVVTETPMAGKYMLIRGIPSACLVLPTGKLFLSSALEYMLNNIQRLSLRLCYGSVSSHFPTRGCILGFRRTSAGH
jgi:hypothetical protein